jgi:hypothetical protein
MSATPLLSRWDLCTLYKPEVGRGGESKQRDIESTGMLLYNHITTSGE